MPTSGHLNNCHWPKLEVKMCCWWTDDAAKSGLNVEWEGIRLDGGCLQHQWLVCGQGNTWVDGLSRSPSHLRRVAWVDPELLYNGDTFEIWTILSMHKFHGVEKWADLVRNCCHHGSVNILRCSPTLRWYDNFQFIAILEAATLLFMGE